MGFPQHLRSIGSLGKQVKVGDRKRSSTASLGRCSRRSRIREDMFAVCIAVEKRLLMEQGSLYVVGLNNEDRNKYCRFTPLCS